MGSFGSTPDENAAGGDFLRTMDVATAPDGSIYVTDTGITASRNLQLMVILSAAGAFSHRVLVNWDTVGQEASRWMRKGMSILVTPATNVLWYLIKMETSKHSLAALALIMVNFNEPVELRWILPIISMLLIPGTGRVQVLNPTGVEHLYHIVELGCRRLVRRV